MKIAVITGASSGLGREFVKQLCAEQHFDEVWVIARRLDRLEELKCEVGEYIRPISLDLSVQESIEEYKALLEKTAPTVAVLVNAGGYGKMDEFVKLSLDDQLGMIDLNAKALTSMTYATLPFMNKGSQIYEIGSLSAFQPVPYLSVYAATKAYVLNFTRALNTELRHTGIKAMAVCPGWIKTEFFDRAVVDDSVITYYNHIFTPEQVTRRALKDMKKGKDVSVCGFKIRAQVLLTKLAPYRLVEKIWLWQQKKK